MTLILSGTDGLSDVDGSAATPAIRGTDANTGIFFPAADTIAFSEGGVESMRIDASGNMGLGVTPNAWGSGNRAIEMVGGGISATTAEAYAVETFSNCYFDGTNWRYKSTGHANRFVNYGTGTAFEGAFDWYTAASGTAGNTISFTQAMTLDASGLLAIGTTSPASATRLTLDYPGFVQMLMRSSGTDRISLYGDASVSAVDGKANPLAFYAGSAERARIDSSGQLLIGTTTSNSNYGLRISGNRGIDLVGWGNARGEAINLKAHNTSNADAIYFNTSAAQVGVISITSTATSYVTSSDYRLKENIAPMTGALATVSALKPCTYTWKSDGSDGQGFIAHELAEVCPQAVSGKKDAVNEEGSIKPQGVDTSFLVATLTAAIQELKAIVDAQAVEIAALKGTA